MASTSFSPTAAISVGWDLTKKHFWYLVKLFLITGFLPQLVQGMVNQGDSPSLAALLSLAGIIYSFVVAPGVIDIAVNMVRGKSLPLAHIFRRTDAILNLFIAGIIQGVVVLLGYILLILPGIYFGFRLSLTSYYVVDKKMGPMDAIKASWAATKGHVMNLFLYALLSIGVAILGLLALIVGIFVAYPVILLGMTWIYTQLAKK